jgi:hypothetical protein
MIRFFQEIYLTGFVVTFRVSRARNIVYKAGGAIAAITVIEWFILVGILGCIGMFLGTKVLIYVPKPLILIAYFALFFLNQYILFIRRYGIEYEREFDRLDKSRKTLLKASCAILALGAIVFFIWSGIAYRHFSGVDRP